MSRLVSSKEGPLDVKGCKEVIKLREPLGHPVVKCIFPFGSKLVKRSADQPPYSSGAAIHAAIGPCPLEFRIAIVNQATADIVIIALGLRRAKYCSNKIVVEVWRAYSKVSLLQRENAMVKPW